jgi:hypothetical protein
MIAFPDYLRYNSYPMKVHPRTRVCDQVAWQPDQDGIPDINLPIAWAVAITAARGNGFTALEWQVVAIARQDRPSTLRDQSRIARALGAIFGCARANPKLANARLETLRRLSVLAWHHGHSVPLSEICAFQAAGFSSEQVERLFAFIRHRRAIALFP